jgi:hypothetical protein
VDQPRQVRFSRPGLAVQEHRIGRGGGELREGAGFGWKELDLARCFTAMAPKVSIWDLRRSWRHGTSRTSGVLPKEGKSMSGTR